MARSKHNKAAQKPIKPAQTTSKKKTLKKQTKIKIEGAWQRLLSRFLIGRKLQIARSPS
jgi:hypothetical protein